MRGSLLKVSHIEGGLPLPSGRTLRDPISHLPEVTRLDTNQSTCSPRSVGSLEWATEAVLLARRWE